ncbi:MAG: GGDEF domain-containing protein [Afipia sp.]|nr:GGDEF domain-containing protein [Afipia sp.]
MRGATPAIDNRHADEIEGVGGILTPAILARRVKQRRQIQINIGLSYLLDVAVLMVYAYAGVTTATLAAAFGACGLLSVALFIAMSEAHINDRFEDHYLIVFQSTVSLSILLIFTYIAPQVGIVFLCAIFTTFTFSSLRSTPRQSAFGWTMTTAGLAVLFLLTDKPIGMPHDTPIERLGTMLQIALLLGRTMVLGLFSAGLRTSLYKRGVQLKEAYKRIEELAELDELTGSFNRRSIMRMLDDEISRALRSKQPCAVALIDLDWFKRINDKFGHPTGDEVLRTFAITMFANIRSIDRFGRYGGEEFLLILPETEEAAAERTLNRLRAIVADLDWTAISHGMTVTISAGVTKLLPDDTPDSILARADGALYRAKDLGRNKVVQV